MFEKMDHFRYEFIELETEPLLSVAHKVTSLQPSPSTIDIYAGTTTTLTHIHSLENQQRHRGKILVERAVDFVTRLCNGRRGRRETEQWV